MGLRGSVLKHTSSLSNQITLENLSSAMTILHNLYRYAKRACSANYLMNVASSKLDGLDIPDC